MAETLAPALPDEIVAKAEAVLELACEKEMKLTTAESCTGGLLASLLTDVPGSSHIFDRGIVAYSDEAKCDLLDIDRNTVKDCGAVSKEVAIAMAWGALAQSGGGIAVAITGFAGPGGDGDEEGLVHFACVRDGFDVAHREEHFGPIGRAGVRRQSIEVALEMIEAALKA